MEKEGISMNEEKKNLTEEERKKLKEKLKKQVDEMSDEELDKVAGGSSFPLYDFGCYCADNGYTAEALKLLEEKGEEAALSYLKEKAQEGGFPLWIAEDLFYLRLRRQIL